MEIYTYLLSQNNLKNKKKQSDMNAILVYYSCIIMKTAKIIKILALISNRTIFILFNPGVVFQTFPIIIFI